MGRHGGGEVGLGSGEEGLALKMLGGVVARGSEACSYSSMRAEAAPCRGNPPGVALLPAQLSGATTLPGLALATHF